MVPKICKKTSCRAANPMPNQLSLTAKLQHAPTLASIPTTRHPTSRTNTSVSTTMPSPRKMSCRSRQKSSSTELSRPCSASTTTFTTTTQVLRQLELFVLNNFSSRCLSTFIVGTDPVIMVSKSWDGVRKMVLLTGWWPTPGGPSGPVWVDSSRF
jgi:hypothetical protein